MTTVKKFLLITGSCLVFYVLITPGNQPYQAGCGGLLIGVYSFIVGFEKTKHLY